MIRKLMFENYDLTYNLMKEDRKTVSLSVLPNEKIILKIPSIASNEKADKFIVNKLNWILKQQDFFKKFNKKKISKKYVSGEDFIYLGRRYLLIIKGIFFCFNSISAINKGSQIPSGISI